MWGGMKGFMGDSDDGREQSHARVTKVLGIVQFVLGVAVICARVAEVVGNAGLAFPERSGSSPKWRTPNEIFQRKSAYFQRNSNESQVSMKVTCFHAIFLHLIVKVISDHKFEVL